MAPDPVEKGFDRTVSFQYLDRCNPRVPPGYMAGPITVEEFIRRMGVHPKKGPVALVYHWTELLPMDHVMTALPVLSTYGIVYESDM